MLGGVDLNWIDRLIFRERGQELIFAADAGDFHEAVEDELAAGGAEYRFAAFGGNGNVDRGLIEFSRGHLAGDETGPDQLIDLVFVGTELGVGFLWSEGGIGRA